MVDQEATLATRHCVFCEIIARREPSEILHEDEDVIVIRNVLKWVPVMLLAIPKSHITQAELWTNPAVAQLSRVAAWLGAEHCPEGFRLVANFGRHAMQSQNHGHLHILGGTYLGDYA